MANWIEVKEHVVNTIVKAGITDREVIQVILKLHRCANTCRNMQANGCSQEYITYTKPAMQFEELMEQLYISYVPSVKPKFYEQWLAYCKVGNIVPSADLFDWLA